MTMTDGARKQREHYDAILNDYDRHYGDLSSTEYRWRFFMAPLLRDFDLAGCNVADVACGSGHTTQLLQTRYPSARFVGFDVAPEAVSSYRANTGCEAHVWDITGGPCPTGPFDVSIVVGGLHHCAHAVDKALRNIAGMLRAGGVVLIVEPNRDSWLEFARQVWYRHDRYFEASTEAALSHRALLQATSDFECLFVRYLGGPAYFLVYNSLVFRIPSWLKRVIAAPLMALEPWANRLPGKWPYPYFVARWRRR